MENQIRENNQNQPIEIQKEKAAEEENYIFFDNNSKKFTKYT